MQTKQLELTAELLKHGINEVYYDNNQIEIIFNRVDGNTDVIVVPVIKYAHDTLEQLDSLVNGLMTTETFTQLKYYLTLELSPIWNEIYQEKIEVLSNQILSVSQAKRLHSGTVTVIGTITSVSEIYVLEIKNNDVIEYRNAKSIQLEDIETLNDNDRLNVVLYDDMTNKVIAGETAKITGNISIEDKKLNNKSKKKFNVLHASSIEYLNRKEILVTKEDIESFDKFVTYPNPVDRLTAMFAPNIIGHDNIKRGLLRSAVGGVDRGKNGGGRIDTLEVGDSGTAKSKLGAEITELKPNSRHVSAPHGTSKTITAVPEKINDIVTVQLGAIPLSKYGVCAIDEINSWSIDEQALLLDIMEEGFF
jgi:hypothetical protein